MATQDRFFRKKKKYVDARPFRTCEGPSMEDTDHIFGVVQADLVSLWPSPEDKQAWENVHQALQSPPAAPPEPPSGRSISFIDETDEN